MIFYFSGTGNSQWVAQELAVRTKDEAVLLTKAKKVYKLGKDEKVGFVFPIYAWSAPQCVWDFIHTVVFENYEGNYIYFVATCHSQTGAIDTLMKKALWKRHLDCDAGFSIRMPNNYMTAPFVKIDSPAKKKAILAAAVRQVAQIASMIQAKRPVFKLTRGFGGELLSRIGSFLFKRFMTVDGFYVLDRCNNCGRCAAVCPMDNIAVEELPVWGSRCVLCLGCLNRCPQEAIQYGRYSLGKERYCFSKKDLPDQR